MKSYQRAGGPGAEDVLDTVVGFVRRAVELAGGGTLPVYRVALTARHHRGPDPQAGRVTYGQAKARQIIEQSVRGEGAAKISPADLIPIALEKVVKAGLELPGFSTTKNPTEAARLDPYGHGGAHGLLCTQQPARQPGFAFLAPPDTRSSAANPDEGAAAIEGHAWVRAGTVCARRIPAGCSHEPHNCRL
ncbi:hypothetical protein AB0L80_40420 [Streptomyces sp. NPDC052069]|uniref:hypothetical protein n=1 Tax=Streptomyces sp. NPDC052069 TaxID=3154650 RepID=UPI003446C515